MPFPLIAFHPFTVRDKTFCQHCPVHNLLNQLQNRHFPSGPHLHCIPIFHSYILQLFRDFIRSQFLNPN